MLASHALSAINQRITPVIVCLKWLDGRLHATKPLSIANRLKNNALTIGK
jgi:hypothetical protein